MSFSANPFGALDDDAAPAPAAAKKSTGDAKPAAKGASDATRVGARWGDEKSRETNARRRGDDIKNARNEWLKTFVSICARGAIEPTARGATPGAESPSDEW